MYSNYLKMAWRKLLAGNVYSFIIVLCLAAGLTGAILIMLFVNHELSYDTHHKNADRIYRIEGHYRVGHTTDHLAITSVALAVALKQEFTLIEQTARILTSQESMVRIGAQQYLEKDFVFSDEHLFEVFTHHFIHGSPLDLLSKPHQLVLSQSLSQKYFGDINPVGLVVEIDQLNYTVAAVIEDLPDNSHLRYQAIKSLITIGEHVNSLDPAIFWTVPSNYTYVLLQEGADMEQVLGNMEVFSARYIDPVGQIIGSGQHFSATRLRDTHFSQLKYAGSTGNKINLMIFVVVAVFLVVIASVNYTNLATARASVRAREIGIRKVAGASRKQLIFQFLVESALISFLSLVVALLLVELLLPVFNNLSGKSFRLMQLFEAGLFLQVILVALLTALAAGSYPAFYLSGLLPWHILQRAAHSKGSSGNLRKTLVVFQFVISILLIIGTITVYQQLHFLQNKELGFVQHERMFLVIPPGEARQKVTQIEDALAQMPGVKTFSKGFSVPGRGFNKTVVRVFREGERVETGMVINFVDPQYLPVLGLQVLYGNDFVALESKAPGQYAVINEKALHYLGWSPQEALHQSIEFDFDDSGQHLNSLQVVGVVNNFNFNSLHNPVEPLMMVLSEDPNHAGYILIHYVPESFQDLLSLIQAQWEHIFPSFPLNYGFLEESFREHYSVERKLGRIFGYFSGLCLLISFAGLFGLSCFFAEQKRKEVGIRKVLGGSLGSILWLFYKEFGKLSLWAFVIAVPLGWYLLDEWLNGFAYRVALSYQSFVLAGTLAMVITLLTVSYQALRSATSNPVDAIKYE